MDPWLGSDNYTYLGMITNGIPDGIGIITDYRSTIISEIKNGNCLKAAGYTVFSTSLQVIWTSNQTNCYNYNFAHKYWICNKLNHKIPFEGKIYSINEGHSKEFYPDMLQFVENFKGKSIRWMCCMVTDIHRSLIEGGCFMYPKNKKSTKGKLRLIYELYPMAFIWTKAGGYAYLSLNKDNILDKAFPHDNIHLKEGCIFLGPKENNLLNK